MPKPFLLPLLLFLAFAGLAKAQPAKNVSAYVGYALFNEPNVTVEYRAGKRLAVNWEAGVFVPFTKGQSAGGMFDGFWARLNGIGGALRGGVAVYGQKRFGVMHRVMLDVTYFSSNTYEEEFAVQFVTRNDYRRKFIQSTIFYELTFRFARDKRHHLFLRAGVGPRFVWKTITYVQPDSYPGYATNSTSFSVGAAPVVSIGYRVRLFPQKGYFVREGL